jgi:UDP-N-acetylglucosamine transferase subunit ALG13
VIFLTVGTQLPFDRLVGAVDRWAGQNGAAMFAQIGPGGRAPRHAGHRELLDPQECSRRIAAADVVVAHAGVGTILAALQAGRPVLVVPRRARLGEHRNDHQLATARRLGALEGVTVVEDEQHVGTALDALIRDPGTTRLADQASPDLLRAVAGFVHARAGAPACL